MSRARSEQGVVTVTDDRKAAASLSDWSVRVGRLDRNDYVSVLRASFD